MPASLSVPVERWFPAIFPKSFSTFLKIVLEAAKEREVGIRLADDFSMPWSGCFREMLNQNENLRARNLVLKETVLKQEGKTFEYTAANPAETIVLAARVKDRQVNDTDVKQLSFQGNAPLSWKAPGGEWRVFVFEQAYIRDVAGGYMPNVFNSRTAQQYIQCVLNVFKARFAKYIGVTFKGFLTEMPAFRPSDDTLPWNDDLVLRFRSKYKKDLVHCLPALFCDAQQAGRIRNLVYANIDQAMYERFALTLETWAKNFKMTQWVLCPERTLYHASHPLVDGDFHNEAKLAHVGIQNMEGTEHNYSLFRAMADCNATTYCRGTIAVIGRNSTGEAATMQSLKDEIVLSALAGASTIIIDGAFFLPGSAQLPENAAQSGLGALPRRPFQSIVRLCGKPA